MEDIINFMTKYAIFPIALICFVVGYVIKHFIPKMPNKFIPLILAILGVFLNVAFNNFTFTFDIVISPLPKKTRFPSLVTTPFLLLSELSQRTELPSLLM